MKLEQMYLIPPAVRDCVEGLLSEKNNSDIRNNFEQRVDAIHQLCQEALIKYRSEIRRFDKKYMRN